MTKTKSLCPRCNQELKVRMNKKIGERIFCSNTSCKYPEPEPTGGVEMLSRRGKGNLNPPKNGVKIINNRG